MKKEDRIKVWEKYDHHCAYCGKVLKYAMLGYMVVHVLHKRP